MEEVEGFLTEIKGDQVSVSVQTKITRCPRCQGFIVFDMVLGDDGGWADDVRCVNCGERFFGSVNHEYKRALKSYRKRR